MVRPDRLDGALRGRQPVRYSDHLPLGSLLGFIAPPTPFRRFLMGSAPQGSVHGLRAGQR